jgi:hypothetical protein
MRARGGEREPDQEGSKEADEEGVLGDTYYGRDGRSVLRQQLRPTSVCR